MSEPGSLNRNSPYLRGLIVNRSKVREYRAALDQYQWGRPVKRDPCLAELDRLDAAERTANKGKPL